jgi:hypothetical protein
LDGPQIKPQGPGIFAAKVKRWHVWMVNHQAISETVHKTVQIDTATEVAKWRGSGMRTFAPTADGMALRTHALGQSAALLFHRAKRDLLAERGRCSEQQCEDCESNRHVEADNEASRIDARPCAPSQSITANSRSRSNGALVGTPISYKHIFRTNPLAL